MSTEIAVAPEAATAPLAPVIRLKRPTSPAVAYAHQELDEAVATIVREPSLAAGQLPTQARLIGSYIKAGELEERPASRALADAAVQVGIDRREAERVIASAFERGQPMSAGAFNELTDLGNARRFVAQHGHRVRHLTVRKRWLEFDGRRWCEDVGGVVARLAKQTAVRIGAEPGHPSTVDLSRWANRSQNSGSIRAMLELASTELNISVQLEELDVDQWLLNIDPGNMTLTETLPRTASRSAQLVAASERMTLDPFTQVEWDIPIDDSAYHLPPEWLPLYGTASWDAMDEPARITYSRHECAALCGAGIWFENRLMQLVLRHLAELPVTSPAHRYLLVEVADECRHSTMFGEYIRRAGTPAYSPAADTPTVDTLSDVPGQRALGYLLILAVEELLDATNRATMKDDRVHPVSRQIAKLHVLEEARHVSFAKTYLAEVWPALDDDERDAVKALAPDAVAIVAALTVDPAVHEERGIPDGEQVARSNPHHRARVIEGLAKLTAFLAELGVIDATTTPTWRDLGLVA